MATFEKKKGGRSTIVALSPFMAKKSQYLIKCTQHYSGITIISYTHIKVWKAN